MLNLSHAPGPRIADFVKRLWQFSDVPPHARERILPSGNFELVVNLQEDEIRVYDPVRPERCRRAPPAPSSSATLAAAAPARKRAVVRYQVADVERSAAFYTQRLAFQLEQRTGGAFASVTFENLRLLLSGPGSSGSRPMPDGRRQEPGGWTCIVLYVDGLDALITRLATAGVHFRNRIEAGPGGRQIQIEDPDGNPIELHEEPARVTRK
jgi:glyoxylase I family protein